MRRFVATLVLSVLAWGSLAPVALGITGADTPACCRRNGKHDCNGAAGKMRGTDAASQASLIARSSDCSYRVHQATLTETASPQAQTVSVLELSASVLVSLADSEFSDLILATSNSQRGPPAV